MMDRLLGATEIAIRLIAERNEMRERLRDLGRIVGLPVETPEERRRLVKAVRERVGAGRETK